MFLPELNEQKKLSPLRSLRNYFECFIISSFIGWVYEVFCCGILDKNTGFVNRGFLFGPWLPIYGMGLFIVLFFIKLFKADTPLKVFLVGAIVATLAELVASYIMELLIGEFLWTYEDLFLNFQGRISLTTSLCFGLLSLAAVYLFIPKLRKFQDKYDKSRLHNTLVIIISVLFFADLVSRFFLGSNFLESVNGTASMIRFLKG